MAALVLPNEWRRMNSMTGYGFSQAKNRQLELDVHVKSVNGRFLEVRFHLPKEYAPFENDFRKAFAGWSRGTVDVYVHRRPATETRLQSVAIREDHARHWSREIAVLAKKLKVENDVTMSELLQLPYVLEHQERGNVQPGEVALAQKQLALAIKACAKVRAAEGVGLKRELLAQLKALDTAVDGMNDKREEAKKLLAARLKARLAPMDVENLDASRLALETALALDKMDLQEELVRLREHVRACGKLIQANAAQGKKLDFYCQELLREVNTIGSKSQLAALTEVVVQAKSVIEKFREQVQNIE